MSKVMEFQRDCQTYCQTEKVFFETVHDSENEKSRARFCKVV